MEKFGLEEGAVAHGRAKGRLQLLGCLAAVVQLVQPGFAHGAGGQRTGIGQVARRPGIHDVLYPQSGIQQVDGG